MTKHAIGSGPVIARGTICIRWSSSCCTRRPEAEDCRSRSSRSGAEPAPTPTRSSQPIRGPHRAGLGPVPLHALAGRAGLAGGHRGRGKADRRLRPAPHAGHVLRALSGGERRAAPVRHRRHAGRAAPPTPTAMRCTHALREVHGVDRGGLTRTVSPRRPHRRRRSPARCCSAAGVDTHGSTSGPIAVREACCQIYARLCPPISRDTVLPGCRDLLDWLTAHDDVRLALVTGNFEPVARLKLREAGIGQYFPTGQGALRLGHRGPRRAAGRSPGAAPGSAASPIRAARRSWSATRRATSPAPSADGVRCIAVATGPFERPRTLQGGRSGWSATRRELRRCSPDAF